METEICYALINEDKLKFTGSGKSKRTAILFKNIDDEFEFIDLQYKYMDFKKIRAFSQAVIFGKKFAYDVHETSIGKLWFKFPLKILLVTQINRRGKNDE